jgi:Fe-S-cluster containining protein
MLGNKSMIKKLSKREVPCNSCTLCCQGDAIRLEAEDRAADYQTEPHPYIPGALMLAHKPNGECIYLNEKGCSIHDRAPSLCRIADCRTIAARIDFEKARQLHLAGRLDIRVWDQGHRLLDAMKAQSSKNLS